MAENVTEKLHLQWLKTSLGEALEVLSYSPELVEKYEKRIQGIYDDVESDLVEVKRKERKKNYEASIGTD